jgi:hypothetical protein
MIWPETLVNAALFNTMHSMYLDEQEVETSSTDRASTINRSPSHLDSPPSAWFSLLSWVPFFSASNSKKAHPRFVFFSRALALATMWSIVPSYLFTALSQFTPLCWIFSGTVPTKVASPNIPSFTAAHKANVTTTASPSPRYTRQFLDGSLSTPPIPKKNIVINQLFGYNTGLGMGILTFDWAMIAYEGSPLVTPWWAEVNVLATLILVFWIVAPIMYCEDL